MRKQRVRAIRQALLAANGSKPVSMRQLRRAKKRYARARGEEATR